MFIISKNVAGHISRIYRFPYRLVSFDVIGERDLKKLILQLRQNKNDPRDPFCAQANLAVFLEVLDQNSIECVEIRSNELNIYLGDRAMALSWWNVLERHMREVFCLDVRER